MTERNVKKYHFKVGKKIVHGGITNDIERREREHKNSGKRTQSGDKIYPRNKGHIVQVGKTVSESSGLDRELKNGFGANQ